MIDAYPRYARAARAARRRAADARRIAGPRRARFSRRRPARPAGLAQAGLDRSARIWTATRGCGGWSPRGAASPRTTSGSLRAGRARAAEPGHPRVPGRRPRAGRSSCRRRRSIIRFCRCCATRTSICGRIPTRGCRGSRFAHPEDAAEQLRAGGRLPRAAVRHAGRSGLWPSEGSVSDAMVPLVAAAGFRVDGDRRADSGAHARASPFSRDGRGHVEQPERLYTPYIVRAGGASVACAFRDHVLSDLIGFTYAGWDAGRGGRRLRRPPGRGRPALPRAHRRGRGAHPDHPRRRERLGALRRAAAGRSCAPCTGGSSDHPELRTVTMAEACAAPTRELHGDLSRVLDRRQLLHLDRPRRRPARLESAGRGARGARRAPPASTPATLAAGARRDPDRRRQRLVLVVRRRPFVGPRSRVRRSLPPPSPERLPAAAAGRFPTSCSSATSRPAARRRRQTDADGATSRRSLDGEETSYFEWLGAGTLEVRETAGAMHQTDRPTRLS